MKIWHILAILGALGLALYLLNKGITLFKQPSGTSTNVPATLNPTVATTTYGR